MEYMQAHPGEWVTAAEIGEYLMQQEPRVGSRDYARQKAYNKLVLLEKYGDVERKKEDYYLTYWRLVNDRGRHRCPEAHT